MPVNSAAYKRVLRQTAYEQGAILTPTELKNLVLQHGDAALFEGEQKTVFVRVGACNDHVNEGSNSNVSCGLMWISGMTGLRWDHCEGLEGCAQPPCKFRRPAGMQPLPTPLEKGDIHLLRPFINLNDDDYNLFLTVLVAAFRVGRPTPITLITGEHGSGKTTLARIFRRLVDPSSAPVTTASNSERDLQIAASNSWVVNIDNQSKLSDQLSDNLCRLATGSGLRTRTLYTDSEETIFNAIRPVLMNSIEELATRPDFLDRTVHLHTREITERKPESSMWVHFEKCVPSILGGLMTAVSLAMKDEPNMTGDFPRMADYARWSMAAAPALGITAEAFAKAYEANRIKGVYVALDASPIYLLLHAVARKGDFRGTTKELLALMVKEAAHDQRDLPRNARALSSALDRLIPDLRVDGIKIRRVGRDSLRRVQIIEMTKEARTEQEIAEKEASEKAAKVKQAFATDHRKACREFLLTALSKGPVTVEDIRKMVHGHRPMPDGTTNRVRYENSFLETVAAELRRECVILWTGTAKKDTWRLFASDVSDISDVSEAGS